MPVMAPVAAPKPNPVDQATQAQQSAAMAATSRQKGNLAFLRTALRKYVVCPPSGGSGIFQTFVAGQTLQYDVPSINGGYLETLQFQCALTVNPATGTGATYALTAGAPYSCFDRIFVEYNGTQVQVRPILLKWLEQLKGYERAQPEQINSGQSVSFVGNTVWGTPFALTTATNNPWNFWFRLPLRQIPRGVGGMLPIQFDGTKVLVKVVCTNIPMGNDPLFSPVATTGGTGASVVIGGTVKVLAIYRDGNNLVQVANLGMDLAGEPTVQWYMDRQINPLVAGSLMPQRIDNKLQHLFAISVILDAQLTSKFCADSNIQALELRQDGGGQNKFFSFGTYGANVGITEFFEQFRSAEGIGQDLDEGVIPWVPGPAFLGLNPDNQEGASYLNMMSGGWGDASYGIQVQTVGALAGVTARVETYLVSVNPLGLVKA